METRQLIFNGRSRIENDLMVNGDELQNESEL